MGSLRSQARLSDFTLTFHFHALEKEMATHSSVLAWRIPGTGEPGGLPSLGSHSWTRLKQLSSRMLRNLPVALILTSLGSFCYFTHMALPIGTTSASRATLAAAAAAKSLQLCPTLRGPLDCSLPGSSVHGIFQARVLEWVAIAFSATLASRYLS